MLEYNRILGSKIFLFIFLNLFFLKSTSERYAYKHFLASITNYCNELRDGIQKNETLNDENFHNDLKAINFIFEIFIKKYASKGRRRNFDYVKNPLQAQKVSQTIPKSKSKSFFEKKISKKKLDHEARIKTSLKAEQTEDKTKISSHNETVPTEKYIENLDCIHLGISSTAEMKVTSGLSHKRRKSKEDLKMTFAGDAPIDTFLSLKQTLKIDSDTCVTDLQGLGRSIFSDQTEINEKVELSEISDKPVPLFEQYNASEEKKFEKTDILAPSLDFNMVREQQSDFNAINVRLSSYEDTKINENKTNNTELGTPQVCMSSTIDNNAHEDGMNCSVLDGIRVCSPPLETKIKYAKGHMKISNEQIEKEDFNESRLICSLSNDFDHELKENDPQVRREYQMYNDQELLTRILSLGEGYLDLNRDFIILIKSYQSSSCLPQNIHNSILRHKIFQIVFDQMKIFLSVDLLYIFFNAKWGLQSPVFIAKNLELISCNSTVTNESTMFSSLMENQVKLFTQKETQDILENKYKQFSNKKNFLKLQFKCSTLLNNFFDHGHTAKDNLIIRQISDMVNGLEARMETNFRNPKECNTIEKLTNIYEFNNLYDFIRFFEFKLYTYSVIISICNEYSAFQNK